MNEITLEQAQRYYIVPWVMDKSDLGIVNRVRAKYEKYCLQMELEIHDKLWSNAQKIKK
jgi:hypothetical protein